MSGPPYCTGVAASWCPRCGDCVCRDDEGELRCEGLNHPDCPLHNRESKHAEACWLVLCHEHGDGAVALWWRENGAGYTKLIDEAGRYTEAEARAIEDNRGTDVAVRLADAEAAAQRVVQLDRLPGAKSAWRRRHEVRA